MYGVGNTARRDRGCERTCATYDDLESLPHPWWEPDPASFAI